MADLLPPRESGLHRRVGLRRRLYLACRACVARIPSACGLCQGAASGGSLCQFCKAAVLRSVSANMPRCPVCFLALPAGAECADCSRHAPAFDRIIAAFDYAPPGDLLIHYLKAGRRFTSAAMLSGLLADAVRHAAPALPEHAILVPVPASRASILARGFNPAAEIARGLASIWNMECRPGLLRRAQEGTRQTHLGRRERASSVQYLYDCPSRVDGAVIAVVDDVMTTGSTLNSIALQFKAAGAAAVHGVVLARTPYANAEPAPVPVPVPVPVPASVPASIPVPDAADQ